MHQIDHKHGEQLKLWLLKSGKRNGKGLSTRTSNNRVELARSVFQFAVNLGWMPLNPLSLVKPYREIPVRMREPYTPDEVKKLLDAAKALFPWFYPFVLTAALTGDRRGSLCKMTVGDFHPERCELHARPENSKKGKGKIHLLTGELMSVLNRAVEGRPKDAPLFTTWRGAPLNEKIFDPPADMENIPQSRAWYALQKAAGVKPRGIHNLRRGVVTNLAAENVSLDLITSVTGHSVDVARECYLTVNRETQWITVRKLAVLYGLEITSTSPTTGASDPSKNFQVRREEKITISLTPKEAHSVLEIINGEIRFPGIPAQIPAQILNLAFANDCQFESCNIMAERPGFEPGVQV